MDAQDEFAHPQRLSAGAEPRDILIDLDGKIPAEQGSVAAFFRYLTSKLSLRALAHVG